MAAPVVAGVAALHLQARPTLTPAQLRAALITQAKPTLSALSPGSPNRLVSVLEGSAAFTVTPASPVDLGQGNVGVTAPAVRLTLTSSGTLALVLGTVVLGGRDQGDFVITSDGCSGSSLAPGAPCFLDLALRPSTTGTRQASLSIPSNEPASPRLIQLTGTGRANDLTVLRTGSGAGRVVSQPQGIDCGLTCTATFVGAVTLQATPEPGSDFAGWRGAPACAGGPSCLITVVGPSTTVTAVFEVRDAGTATDAGVQVDGGQPDAGRTDAGEPDAGEPDAGAPGDDAGDTTGPRDAGRSMGDAGSFTDEGHVIGSCGCSAGAGSWLLLSALLATMSRRRWQGGRSCTRSR